MNVQRVCFTPHLGSSLGADAHGATLSGVSREGLPSAYAGDWGDAIHNRCVVNILVTGTLVLNVPELRSSGRFTNDSSQQWATIVA